MNAHAVIIKEVTEMKRIALLTSGGDAPGMNAAIRAVVRAGIDAGMQVYGVRRGYEGLIEDDIMEMGRNDVGGILYRGGTILKSARSERFLHGEWVDVAVENLRRRGIDSVVVIGGDGSFHGGLELAKRGISVAGIPGTIDNDLGYTEYTIGFDTALNTVVELINKIRDTSTSHERTTIMEVMGRHCGDIALYSGLACGADIIIVPEVEMNTEELVRRVKEHQAMGKGHIIIAKAEGVDMPVVETQQLLEAVTGQETRSVVPGYIQRGGSPTVQDRLIADLTCGMAIDLLAHPEKRPSDSFAVGVSGSTPFAVDLKDAVEQKRVFRRDIYDLATVLA